MKKENAKWGKGKEKRSKGKKKREKKEKEKKRLIEELVKGKGKMKERKKERWKKKIKERKKKEKEKEGKYEALSFILRTGAFYLWSKIIRESFWKSTIFTLHFSDCFRHQRVLWRIPSQGNLSTFHVFTKSSKCTTLPSGLFGCLNVFGSLVNYISWVPHTLLASKTLKSTSSEDEDKRFCLVHGENFV